MLYAKSRGSRPWLAVFSFSLLLLGSLSASAGPVRDYVGYTSPVSRETPRENFSRPDKDGKIRPVSLIAEGEVSQPSLLSGTVYYMVYERDDRDTKDPWGTGIPNILKHFRSGIDFNGGSSPDLDSLAKYLYLYQVVNHQRTMPPIESTSIKLLVDLSEISSWGYFHGLGFASNDITTGTFRPLSATHKLDPRSYLSPAPALPLVQNFSLAPVPSSRGEVEPMRDSGKIVQVLWDALDPATPPDYVMILGSSDFDKHPSFRSIWSGKNAIGKDGRSTVFGFTSNLPPTIEPMRLRTSRDPAKLAAKEAEKFEAKGDKTTPVANDAAGKAKDAVKLARLAEEESGPGGETILGVEGRVPTPYPITPASAFKADLGKDLGNTKDSGAGLPFGMPMVAAPPASSSSGIGSGTSLNNRNTPTTSGGTQASGGGISGRGNGSVIVQGGGEASGSGTGDASSSTTVNFNVSMSNQQSQSQYQTQNQSQSQSQSQGQGQGQGQNQGGGGNGNVVPEPASLIGLALGLPALLVAYRRRRLANPETPTSDEPTA